MATRGTRMTEKKLARLIEATRREAQRAWERGDHSLVRHYEERITRLNQRWGEVSR